MGSLAQWMEKERKTETKSRCRHYLIDEILFAKRHLAIQESNPHLNNYLQSRLLLFAFSPLWSSSTIQRCNFSLYYYSFYTDLIPLKYITYFKTQNKLL